ncbi:hypothetical protein WN73_38470 [Bradyrhizobium sp. CCBAU 45394]|uniref:hypothetical protein n=1 Tax=Bradyrhizobium sp. CCBAU 45394 TaxID=1325087 RepID=UPI002304C36A|nr:hypothetical protein [Bradyrhizobium sp. CCBAU 45394]MDA9396399.1 hypothetical protein [Bradyrhizobium sp. CCBAU 45394]
MATIIKFAPRPRSNDTPPEPNVRRIFLRREKRAQTATAQNQNLRARRFDAWVDADRQLAYWDARLELWSAIRCAQMRDVPEGDLHPEVHYSERHALQQRRDEALARKLLTPAHSTAAVEWKRRLLGNGKFKPSGLSAQRLQYAIDQDQEFLASHPARKVSRGDAK